MRDTARQIVFVSFPGMQLLDLSGPLQVFASANDCVRGHGGTPPYALRVVARTGGAVRASAGLSVLADALPQRAARIDTLVVAGGEGVYAAVGDTVLIAWIRRQAARARRLASVCSGAFLLAEAGLLDGRRVATHWTRCEQLAQRYPRLIVEADPIFVRDGPVWTSAGVTAGIDLALALVEEDLGRGIALDVARELVVFLKRPGGQAQFSAALSMQGEGAADRFAALHQWIGDHLSADLSVPALAQQAGMSERSFIRRYRETTGRTPARAVEQFRVEAAQRLLTESRLPLKRVAGRCGFGSEETLRRSFLRILGVTPQAYRMRFTV